MSAIVKKVLIAIVVLLIVTGISWKFWGNKSDPQMLNFVEYKVQKGNLKIQILSTGIVQPENKVEIKPPIAGRVDKVLVSEGNRVRKGQVLALMSSTERAALLDAASSKGPKEVKEWEEMYRATPIIAAINGTIIQKNVESGQTFTTNDAVLVMSDRLTVKAQVDETDIAQIKLKQKAHITLDAYPDQIMEAQVDQIAFDAKTVNNVTTYIVDVLPNEAPKYMRSGMTANVSFDIDSRQDVVVVPNEAIKNIEVRNIVYMANNEDKKKPIEREVQLGLSDGKKTEIVSGLEVGETIMMKEFKMKDKKNGGSPFDPSMRPKGGHGK